MSSDIFPIAAKAFNRAHLQDPNTDVDNGKVVPYEWLYAKRLVECLERVHPDASEALRIAAYCQHLYRWEIKRSEYPEGRTGYHRWRNYLGEYQAEKAADILKESGYDDEFISQVMAILKKRNIFRNEDAAKLEDIVCLVFIQYYMAGFMQGKSDEQLVDIVKKTWMKMSGNGRHHALQLNLPDSVQRIIKMALS